MAGPWLYAISARSGHNFETKRREPLAVSLKTYEEILRSGELAEDEWWYISQNWKKIEQDDEVFIYTGDHDRGLIGYATAKEVKKRGGDWYINMNFDLRKCLELLDSPPISANMVRKWVHFPRRNVNDLARYDSQIQRLLPWHKRPKKKRG